MKCSKSNIEMILDEECWIIYGIKSSKFYYGFMKYESKGDPGTVDFNWDKIIKKRKRIIGFVHTHPGGFAIPSTIDDHTMKGWVKALGKPLLCGIKTGNNITMYIYEKNGNQVESKRIPHNTFNNLIRVG